MTETMNRLGHVMGLKTVGEFAESQSVLENLQALGVDFAQGHGVHVPQPLPVSEYALKHLHQPKRQQSSASS